MRCVAMVARGQHVAVCDAECEGRYCPVHADRDAVLRDKAQRERIVAQRVKDAHAASKLPPEVRRPRRKLHARLQWIIDVMDNERYYGREAHQRTLHMLEQESRSVTQDILRKQIDPFDVPAIERDIQELILRSQGKMMATRLKMAERDKSATRTDKEDALSHSKAGPLSLDAIRKARGL